MRYNKFRNKRPIKWNQTKYKMKNSQCSAFYTQHRTNRQKRGSYGSKAAMDNFLPDDHELLRREGLFLKLFDKFSVDEGSDPELGELDGSDDTVEDNSVSGSSFSETSDIESASDSSSVIENIKQQIQPVIEDRVHAWPEKGFNLQLKTVDPSVTVDEWLKANSEFTTTTKKYKKTVVSENNKTIVTTTKQTKTTTKKTSFQSFMPRVVRNDESKSDHMMAIEDKKSSNDTRPIRNGNCAEKETKQEKRRKKPKNRKETEITSQVPDSIHYPQNNAKQNKGNRVDAKHAADIVEASVKPTRKYKVQSNLEGNKHGDVLSKQKTSDHDHVTSIVDSTNRFLRPRNKENIATVNKTQKKQDSLKPTMLKSEKALKPKKFASQIRKKPVDRLPPSLKETIPSQIVRALRNKKNLVNVNKTQEKQDNPKLTKLKPEASNSIRSDIHKKAVHRSRSPLKEKSSTQNERAMRDQKIKNATVRLERLPHRVNTRRNAQIKNTEQPVSTFTETDSQLDCNNDERIRINNVETKKSTRHKKPPKRPIVIHAPGSDTILGTKIDDTFMLVTKRDYEKHINPRDLRETDRCFLNNSIIPINRKIIYEPPTTNIEENSGSDCEDVLLTSYTNVGHILQIGVKR